MTVLSFPRQNVRSLVRDGHLGLAGMYERARLFHGELNISSDPAMGTTVSLRLPCPPEVVVLSRGCRGMRLAYPGTQCW